jgi:hypothetical protein
MGEIDAPDQAAARSSLVAQGFLATSILLTVIGPGTSGSPPDQSQPPIIPQVLNRARSTLGTPTSAAPSAPAPAQPSAPYGMPIPNPYSAFGRVVYEGEGDNRRRPPSAIPIPVVSPLPTWRQWFGSMASNASQPFAAASNWATGRSSGSREQDIEEDWGMYRTRGGLSQAASNVGDPAAQGAGIFGAIQGIGQLAGGAIGALLGPFGKLGKAILDTVSALNKWSDGVHKSNMQYADFSGSMAQVLGEQALFDMRMSIAKGEALAETARETAKARNERKIAQLPYEMAWAKTENWLARRWEGLQTSAWESYPMMLAGGPIGASVGLMKIFGDQLSAMTGIETGLSEKVFKPLSNWLSDKLGINSDDKLIPESASVQKWMDDVGKDWADKFGRHPRFGM